MAWYQVASLIVSAIISILSFLGINVIIKYHIDDKHKKKIDETEEAKRKQKELRQKEIKDAVSEIVNPFADRVEIQISKISNRLNLSEQCDQAILRNSLMGLYYDCRDKGYRTEDDSKNYFEMHSAYNAVGGNSFIDTEVTKWFEEIPLKPNGYVKPKTKKKGGGSKSE